MLRSNLASTCSTQVQGINSQNMSADWLKTDFRGNSRFESFSLWQMYMIWFRMWKQILFESLQLKISHILSKICGVIFRSCICIISTERKACFDECQTTWKGSAFAYPLLDVSVSRRILVMLQLALSANDSPKIARAGKFLHLRKYSCCIIALSRYQIWLWHLQSFIRLYFECLRLCCRA